MGSAAFLVAACHFLAGAYERALVSEGEFHPGEVDEAARAGFRRQIAQRCLYGVDLNPTAVQLARLSLWLATLAAGKPLTFLDHHLAVGNSLLGASLVDMAQASAAGPVRGDPRNLKRDAAVLRRDLEPSLAAIVGERRWISDTPDDKPDVVREKEHRLERIREGSSMEDLADLWCACWMWPDSAVAPDAAIFAIACRCILRGQGELPAPRPSACWRRARCVGIAAVLSLDAGVSGAVFPRRRRTGPESRI